MNFRSRFILPRFCLPSPLRLIRRLTRRLTALRRHFSPTVKLNGKFGYGTATGVTVYCHLPAAASGTSIVKVAVPCLFQPRAVRAPTTVNRSRAPRSSKPRTNCKRPRAAALVGRR